jgi:hypothetical protein
MGHSFMPIRVPSNFLWDIDETWYNRRKILYILGHHPDFSGPIHYKSLCA